MQRKKLKKVQLTMKRNLEVATMQSLFYSDFSEIEIEIVGQFEKNQ